MSLYTIFIFFYKSQETINFCMSRFYKQVYICMKGHNAIWLGRFKIDSAIARSVLSQKPNYRSGGGSNQVTSDSFL